tara:strand:- start:2128 stop:2991 length:864 start_codon:yes stop_codon:yes gene_type:complete
MKKKFLVTGASGFIASHVSDLLTKKGFEVILFDKKFSKYKQKKQKMFLGNLKNLNNLIKATKKVDTIFHFAADADLNESNRNPFETIENNINGTVKIIKACIKNKIKKIIFASSIYAISEQGGIYSTSKLSSEMIIERLCKKFNIKFVILRFGTVYGERANTFNTVQKYINQARDKLKIHRETKGNEIRSYIHVKDVANVVCLSLKKKYENNYYNIFGKKKILVKELFNILKDEIPGLKISYSKSDKKKYNYKVNPFTYKIRKGSNIRLKKYIDVKNGVSNLIRNDI